MTGFRTQSVGNKVCVCYSSNPEGRSDQPLEYCSFNSRHLERNQIFSRLLHSSQLFRVQCSSSFISWETHLHCANLAIITRITFTNTHTHTRGAITFACAISFRITKMFTIAGLFKCFPSSCPIIRSFSSILAVRVRAGLTDFYCKYVSACRPVLPCTIGS